MIMTFTDPAANDNRSARYPHPFDTPEPGYIVTIAGYEGLHEALEQCPDGRWIFHDFSTAGQGLVYAHPDEMTVFDLPIYHSFASRDRSEIVAVVSGADFDVTYNDPEVAAPLFQKIHATELIEFCEMALVADFSTIQLTNGYVPWEGTVEELIEKCRELAATS